MSKRKYIKKNGAYWSSLGRRTFVENISNDYQPEIVGSPIYVSSASSYSRNGQNPNNRTTRSNHNFSTPSTNEYSNIDSFSLPFEYEKNTGLSNIKEPIAFCQKAYFHVPVFKNTIDLLAELSDSNLILSGGTKASREFIKKWMDSARIDNIKSQFFREYYRSGNVFLYRMFAKFSAQELAAMKTIYAKNIELIPQDSGFPSNSLPMRYIILNPMDIVNYESIGTTTVYKKVLTKFEAIKLKNPQTEEEKRILQKVKTENTKTDLTHLDANELYIDLEPNRVIYSFYKKQDYEPFAIPFGFPVLRDINWKLELKKIDQSVSRSLENIILLITMGNDPDKGGINPKNLEAMKQLFSSEAVGRVLVADYTTKAQFIIPQLDNILSKAKYEIVNQDIRDGLQNIFFEDSKYSNNEIKIKIFFEKLKEGQKSFLNDFLQPEIKKICSAMGFRDFPKIRFKSSNLINESEIQKAAMRLMELGVLIPRQGIESINSKELPDASEIGENQKEYIESRKDGLYTPLVGGQPLYQPEINTQETNGSPVPNTKQKIGRPKNGSIAKEELLSVKNISEIAKKASELESYAAQHMKEKNKLESLSKEQELAIKSICGSIVESTEIENWKNTFSQCISSLNTLDKLNIKPEILDISKDYNVGSYEAAMIYHSKKIKI
jgi:hypothetical protein